MKKNLVFFILFLFSSVLLSCEDRERNNIFDPNNKTKKIDIGFKLTSNDSSITLSWNSPGDVKFKSVNIFRKVQGETESISYATVEKGTTIFVDPEIIYDIKYSYFITINGETEESYPTKILSITPGPGSIWILDTYSWEINKLNYDLSSVSFRKMAAWRPENLTFAKELNLALVTYPQLRDMEIFDLRTGESKTGNDNLGHPFDAAYDSDNKVFWLVDSSGSLYTIDTDDANAQQITQGLSKPVQIDLFNQDLYVLDQGFNKIFIYNTSPQLIDSIFLTPNNEPFNFLKQFRIDKINNNFYFVDGKKGNNILYRYNLINKQITKLYQDSIIYSFDINTTDESIWIIIAKHLNSNLVQLFGSEIRYFDISELERPVDIKVNSQNGNFIITDFKLKENIKVPKVFHFRSDISLIGTFSTYGDPSRVYIE